MKRKEELIYVFISAVLLTICLSLYDHYHPLQVALEKENFQKLLFLFIQFLVS